VFLPCTRLAATCTTQAAWRKSDWGDGVTARDGVQHISVKAETELLPKHTGRTYLSKNGELMDICALTYVVMDDAFQWGVLLTPSRLGSSEEVQILLLPVYTREK